MAKQETISVTEFRELAKQERYRNNNKRNAKYGNKITKVDGILFHSKREAEYYGMLKLRIKSGDILRFERQVGYDLIVDGKKVGKYVADFVEYFPDGRTEIIDVKSDITRKIPLYLLKKALMKQLHSIDIIEK